MTTTKQIGARVRNARLVNGRPRPNHRQDAALVAIRGWQESEGREPTIRELAVMLGDITHQSAQRLMDKLYRAGRLETPQVAEMRRVLRSCDRVLVDICNLPQPTSVDNVRRDIAAVLGGSL